MLRLRFGSARSALALTCRGSLPTVLSMSLLANNPSAEAAQSFDPGDESCVCEPEVTADSGAVWAMAARQIRDKTAKIAAHLLEMGEEDLEWELGQFSVKGAPGKRVTIQDCAFAAHTNLPEDMEPGMEATNYYDPPNLRFPAGVGGGPPLLSILVKQRRQRRYSPHLSFYPLFIYRVTGQSR